MGRAISRLYNPIEKEKEKQVPLIIGDKQEMIMKSLNGYKRL